MTLFKDKANLIWDVADLLRGDYRQSDYGKVILPNEFFGYHRITVEPPQKEEDDNVIQSKGKPKPDTKLRDYENIP